MYCTKYAVYHHIVRGWIGDRRVGNSVSRLMSRGERKMLHTTQVTGLLIVRRNQE